jgi:hypothetical protein
MSDPIENIRRQMLADAASDPTAVRAELAVKFGKVWDTEELSNDFEVFGFMAPFIAVRRRSDGVNGSMKFQHLPRFYFSFVADQDTRSGK